MYNTVQFSFHCALNAPITFACCNINKYYVLINADKIESKQKHIRVFKKNHVEKRFRSRLQTDEILLNEPRHIFTFSSIPSVMWISDDFPFLFIESDCISISCEETSQK